MKRLLFSLWRQRYVNVNDDIRDIFHIRKIIEPHIASLAAENAIPQEIEEMETILYEQRVSVGRG